jgi:hypothetical protein
MFMARKSKNIDDKVNAIVMKYAGEFNRLNKDDLDYSRGLFLLTAGFFRALDELGNEGFINYFQGLDRKNITANNKASLERIQLLFLFILRTYNEDKFAQLLHFFYKDPNNNTPLYTEEIKPKESAWKIINFLRALINLFKRKKFRLIDPLISKLCAEETRKKLQGVCAKGYSAFKKDNEELFSIKLTLAIGKIFSIASLQEQAGQIQNDIETWPPPPTPLELSQLSAEDKTVPSNNAKLLSSPPPPPPPQLQAHEKSRQSNVEASHLESAATAVNRVRPPLLREMNVTNQSSTLKKEQKLVQDNKAIRMTLLEEIKGIKLERIKKCGKKLSLKKKGGEPDSLLSLNGLKNSLQVYEESKEKNNEAIDQIIARQKAWNQSSSSSFSSQDSSGDEWNNDEQAPILTQGIADISKRTLNSRTSDSGHGSSSSLDSEEESETLKGLGSVIKQGNTILFKGSGSEEDEKTQPIENTPYSVKELR